MLRLGDAAICADVGLAFLAEGPKLRKRIILEDEAPS